MGKVKPNGNIQIDSRLSYLWTLSQFAPQFGSRLLTLSKKSQRRITPAIKRRICECGRRLNHWQIEEKVVRGRCETCGKERVLKRYLKNGLDLSEELSFTLTEIVRNKTSKKPKVQRQKQKSGSQIQSQANNSSKNNEDAKLKKQDTPKITPKKFKGKKGSSSQSIFQLNAIFLKASNSIKKGVEQSEMSISHPENDGK